jgi:hypothetical protein
MTHASTLRDLTKSFRIYSLGAPLLLVAVRGLVWRKFREFRVVDGAFSCIEEGERVALIHENALPRGPEPTRAAP